MTTVDAKPQVLYDDAFPKLPNVPSTKKRSGLNGNNSLNILTNKQHVREVLEIPNAERRSTDDSRRENIGRAINDIAKLCGVDIDMSSSKSQSLTIFLTGPKDKIADAKRLVVKEFQVQSSLKVNVNPEYYRFVIGKKGMLLRDLEKETCTKINIPTSVQSTDNQGISISGPREGCELARKKILKIVDEQSKLGSERLLVPKMYHPFVRGPRQANIQRWSEKYNVKIDMPPPSVPADDIFVSGDKTGVEIVVKEIKKIHHEASTNTKTIQAKVKRPQHKFVFGPGGSGIADILEKTGSSVEMPTDESSEIIIIRGPPSNVGRALSMVYEKAESSVCEEIKASNRFHKILIGKKGSNLAEFLSGYQERVKVEFIDNSDKIEIEGPLEDVQEVKKRLVEKIKSLEATMAMVKVKIDTKYKGFVVGRDGANIKRLRDNYNVSVNIVDDSMTNKSEVVIEGDAKGIQKAGEEIKELVQKLENEKIKDLIIEPKLQRLLKTPQNGVVPIREIYDEFPSITIIWSDGTTGLKKNFSVQDQTSSIVKVQGQKQHVDAASEKIMKILKNLKENNFHVEFRLYKEFRQFVFGQNQNEVKKILAETSCRIINPPADEITLSGLTDVDSQIMWIVGKEKSVHVAFDKIEEIQKKQANIKEVRVKLPTIFAKMAGDNSSKLRSIREECDNVNIKFVKGNNKSEHCEMIISGPSEALEKAENLIKELSNKTNEECEEAIVKCDRKYHGYLIGRAGQNISQFRKKHTVQLYFPDKLETDAVIANEIRLVGNKAKMAAAKKDLEDQVKAIETEVELIVQVPSKYLKQINLCKKSDPILSKVRITTPPKEGNIAHAAISLDATEKTDQPTSSDQEMANVKVIGPKNLAEEAKEEINKIVADLQAAISIKYPLEDRNQIRAFYRLKAQFREWENLNRVTVQIHTEPGENDEETGTITLTGRKEQIELVYEQKIKPFMPISEKVDLPHEFHYQLLINPNKESFDRNSAKKPAPKKTEGAPQFQNKVSELQQTFNVNVRIPPAIQTDADYITMRGTPKQIESAKLELAKWQVGWEEEKQLRIAKSFEMTYEIPERLILTIMEKRDHYKKEYDVIIREKGGRKTDEGKPSSEEETKTVVASNGEANGHVSSSSEESSDEEDNGTEGETKKEDAEENTENDKIIPDDAPHRLISTKTTELILKGLEASCLKLKEELDTLVASMKDYVCECLNIPQSIHSQLIGAKRNGVLKMQEEFKVTIEFPSRSYKGEAVHIVVILGLPENVDSCCDNLIYLANELLEKQREREEKYQYQQPQQQTADSTSSTANKDKNNKKKNTNQKDLIIVDAPWSKLA